MENEALKTSTIKNILTAEVKFIIYIITIVLGAVAPYYSIKQDIALIQKDIAIINSNHLSHIQDITQQMKENQSDIKEMQKQIYIIINR
jgi:hypothetical protein